MSDINELLTSMNQSLAGVRRVLRRVRPFARARFLRASDVDADALEAWDAARRKAHADYCAAVELVDASIAKLLDRARHGGLVPDDRTRAVMEAVASMDRDDPELWMKDGRPKAGSVPVSPEASAAERDHAWERLNLSDAGE